MDEGTRRLSQGGCRLTVANSPSVGFTLHPSPKHGYVLGRSDEGGDFIPDVDLLVFAAREMGVSRRHAAVVFIRGEVCLVDLQSSNGTFVDDYRLLPDTPFGLYGHERIYLGTLCLVITPL